MKLEEHIRPIPDFPKPGILFYDISTLLLHQGAFQAAIDAMAAVVERYAPERLMGVESRGFIFGAALATRLGMSFGMVRKKGKLPGSVVGHTYDLEYGNDSIEVSSDLLAPGTRVLVVDDLIATGGTAAASVELLRKIGAEVQACLFLIELQGLGGRARLEVPVERIVAFEG